MSDPVKYPEFIRVGPTPQQELRWRTLDLIAEIRADRLREIAEIQNARWRYRGQLP